MFQRRTVVQVIGAVIMAVGISATRAADAPPWAETVRQLGSADFAQREAAQKNVRAIPAADLEALLEFSASLHDPEITLRLRSRITEMAGERIASQFAWKLPPAAHITGRIINSNPKAAPGKGIAHFPLDLTLAGAGEKLLEFQTDEDGRFDVPVPFAEVLYRVSAAPAVADFNRAVLPEKQPGLGNVNYSFGDAEPINGTVLDEKGAPAVGVAVSLSGGNGVQQTVKTDAQGKFSVITLGPQISSLGVTLMARSKDRAAPLQIVHLPQAPGELKMQLAAPVTIEGTVSSDSGLPIAHAHVTVYVGLDAADYFTDETTTQADGRYRFANLPSGGARRVNSVTARAAGWIPNSRVAVPFNTLSVTDADITMVRPAAIVGRVVDAHGQPVAGAMVGLPEVLQSDWRDQRPAREFVATDAQGRFVVSDGSGGNHGVWAMIAYLPNQGMARLVLGDIKTGDVVQTELKLPGAVHVRGRVADDSGKPLANIVCEVAGVAGPWVQTGTDGIFDMGLVSRNPDGPVQVLFLGPQLQRITATEYGIADLPLSQYVAAPLFATPDKAPPFYENQMVEIDESAGKTVDLKIALAPAQVLEFSGIVVDAKNQPVPNAAVYVLSGETTRESWLANETSVLRDGTPVKTGAPNVIHGAVKSGADGRFRILVVRQNGVGSRPHELPTDWSTYCVGAYAGGPDALQRAWRGDYSSLHDVLIPGIEVPQTTGRVELTVKLP